jgi:glutathionyl-hydroquinone reductase
MPGMLVNGEWKTERQWKNTDGRFVRSKTSFRDWISADGSSDFKAEPGRYHLYVAWACPWAHRTVIMRKLKGLEEVIGFRPSDPLWARTAGLSTTSQASSLTR